MRQRARSGVRASAAGLSAGPPAAAAAQGAAQMCDHPHAGACGARPEQRALP
jgi:hypothetical protein